MSSSDNSKYICRIMLVDMPGGGYAFQAMARQEGEEGEMWQWESTAVGQTPKEAAEKLLRKSPDLRDNVTWDEMFFSPESQVTVEEEFARPKDDLSSTEFKPRLG